MDSSPAMSDRQAALSREIVARRDDLVELTQDLIRIPTLNPPGEFYRDICEYLATRLGRSGFDIKLLRARGTPGDSDRYPRWNVIARREGAGPGPCVHFNSHIDVVETGSGWTFDPFGGTVANGKVYGRGACDMKGGLAASIVAVEAFVALFADFPGAIEISGTADEETGGYGGVAWLAEQGYFSPERVQHVIIPEPLNKDRICLGHRGVWWAQIRTHGRIAHGSMPFLGDCAVRHMGAVMAEMEASLFPALADKRTAMPVVPDGARQSTMNINSIHGGQAEPERGFTGFPSACVPDSARMVIDRRYLIEEQPEEVHEEILALLERVKAARPGFSYDLDVLWQVSPSMTDRDAPVVRAVDRSIRAVLSCEPAYVVSPGTYDQKHVDRIGRLKDCIAYGPGILDLAHQPDEYVGIEDMVDAAKVMAFAMDDLLHRRV
ncbi:succinyl-diaminopimelate desuccinylase [Hoeflea marina]|uniref:Succinyl-diaminopimelate desuccinylase n=1 Tax=Hoeflea marina TaxID=274592 RepID=A0A317PJI4_9HYPH|nr:acetylornithine deacetylase/succinyl-diaminopimelate desuccinylase family protein [Hoeflea marina]PWW00464.1 succinyl-diaminopimelate desuccinylase [Hoeflea marina]